MNDLISDLFPALLSGKLNDLITIPIPDTKNIGQCDASKNRFFSGHSTSPCKPSEDLIIKSKEFHDQQQSRPKKQKQTIHSNKSGKSMVSAQNTSTYSKNSKSVTPPPLNQTKNDKLLAIKKRESIRKANYKKTPEGRKVRRRAAEKYHSSKKGKEKNKEHQANYRKTPKGIIASIISNAKSNAKASALKKGCSIEEAKIAAEKAAKDKKTELLEVFDMPWLQTQPQ